MKQKIVIKVQVRCDRCRSKAMKIASVVDGVVSVALEGEDKDKVVVTGDGVDAATLTKRLNRKLGYASLISVEEMKEKPMQSKDNEDPKVKPTLDTNICSLSCQCRLYEVVYEDPYPKTCTIM